MSRILVIFRALAAGALLGQLAAQPVPNHYLVELTAPALMEGAATLQASEKVARREALRAEQRQAVTRMESLGVDVLGSIERVANLVSIRVPDASIGRIQALPGVKKVYRVYERYPMLDRVTEIHRAAAVWPRVGGIESAGDGQRIGIIDTGIDTRHPGFNDPSLVMPEAYPKAGTDADRADTTPKVIAVRNYDRFYNRPDTASGRDQDGHGTAVAMAAAGTVTRAPLAAVMGMAPKARLGAYRVFPIGQPRARDDAILAAIDDAVADGMNVINLSLGSDINDTNTDSLYARAFTRAAEAGVIVIASAGNEGPGITTIGTPGYLPEAIAVGATWNDRTFRTTARLGSLIVNITPGSGPLPDSVIAAPWRDVVSVDSSGLACAPLPPGSLAGRVVILNRGECFFEEKLGFVQAAGAVGAIVVNNAAGPNIIMSVGNATLPAAMVAQADGARLRERLSQEPDLPGELNIRPAPMVLDRRQVSSFSSRGPAVNRRLKPDVAGVGSFVYTAAVTNPLGEVSDPSGWIQINGTSFSAPAVAGIAALLRQARPGLTVAQYRSLLVNTASEFQTADGATVQPLQVGAGLINAEAATRSQLTSSHLNVSFRPERDQTDQSEEITITNLSAEPQQARLEVIGLGGTVPTLSTNTLEIPGGATAPFTLRLTGTALTPGASQGIVQVTGAGTLRIPYWFAVPSRVPARIEAVGTTPATLSAGAEVQVFFRAIDTSGVGMSIPNLTISTDTPGASIVDTADLDALVNALTGVKVKLPPQPGLLRLAVEAGEERAVFPFIVR